MEYHVQWCLGGCGRALVDPVSCCLRNGFATRRRREHLLIFISRPSPYRVFFTAQPNAVRKMGRVFAHLEKPKSWFRVSSSEGGGVLRVGLGVS